MTRGTIEFRHDGQLINDPNKMLHRVYHNHVIGRLFGRNEPMNSDRHIENQDSMLENLLARLP